MRASTSIASPSLCCIGYRSRLWRGVMLVAEIARRAHGVGKTSLPSHTLDEYLGEPGRRTRWAKSHPELMRLLEERQLS